jgi:sugar (pentulose or hexulose) kinase
MSRTHVLALDLGTSRIKVALVDDSLAVVASAAVSHPTISPEPGAAEQSPLIWLAGIERATRETLAALDEPVSIAAVVLTAQMPTLVALDASGAPVGHAVTWQDARSDELVYARLTRDQRHEIYDVAGTPIDGRYIIPMHLRRLLEEDYAPAVLLSAKDYLYFVLTGEKVTDPSTASGYGNFDLATLDWSPELTSLWGVSVDVLPRVVDPRHRAPLVARGAQLLEGVTLGTPVMVGAADSVCAHHFVSAHVERPITVVDGSSTVILASLERPSRFTHEILFTPLVTPQRHGAELDLLATGSSLAWLAGLLGVSVGELEDLALAHAGPAAGDTLFYPYLAGGEQGALWRDDLSGAIHHLSLATSRGDLALSLFEGIAFETARCVALLQDAQRYDSVVSLSGATSRLLGAAILSAILDIPVVAISQHSPSLLGAALVGLEETGTRAPQLRLQRNDTPALDGAYRDQLRAKFARYLASAPSGVESTESA